MQIPEVPSGSATGRAGAGGEGPPRDRLPASLRARGEGVFAADDPLSQSDLPLTLSHMDAIVARLAAGRGVRRSLPGWGRLHIERELPFLCVYRRPNDRADPGTDRLLLGQAAYLRAPGTAAFRPTLRLLVERLAEEMVRRLSAYLIVEIWSRDELAALPATAPPPPAFRICYPPFDGIKGATEVLAERLGRVRMQALHAEVELAQCNRIAPPGLPPLMSLRRQHEIGCRLLGLEVKPSYVNPETGDLFPLLLRSLRRQIVPALGRTFYRFTRDQTSNPPEHYHALGRRAMVKAVWDVDRKLASISQSFDFLYQVTPINAQPAWLQFRRDRFDKAPLFQYRPLPIDPITMKRALYAVPIDRIEDPTLMHLFLAKQMELDRQLTMLLDLGKRQFLYGSMQLHDVVEPALLEQAREVLDHTPSRSRENRKGHTVNAAQLAAMAQREVSWYRERYPAFEAEVQVTDHMYSGLMVSRSRLLIGHDTRVPEQRVEALLQHEVGTHLLTYFNGRAQPLSLLYTGLPGYDELQEGLAVLAEHLVDGLSVSRLRVLAARVVAAHALVDGASFVDVFRLLDRSYDFSQRTAWTITMRIFRGGGLLKDAVYLRGLVGLLSYLAKGKRLEKLFLGKITAGSMPVIDELIMRGILNPPPITPRYYTIEGTRARLDRLVSPTSLLDLLPHRRRTQR